MDIRNFYTTQDTLAILDVVEMTLTNWNKKGLIKSVKAKNPNNGRTTRMYPIAELRRILGKYADEVIGSTPAPPLSKPILQDREEA